MANKSKPKNHTPIDFKEIIWVINNLPSKDMEIVENMEFGVVELNNFFTEMSENGFTMKFSWDDYSDCQKMIFMCLESGWENSGFAFSARGKDFEHCARICCYKFYEVAKGRLFEVSDAKNKTPRYG